MSKLAVLQVGSFPTLLDAETAGLIEADIRFARDPVTGMAAATVKRPDLILFGNLPGDSALESCRSLKSNPSLNLIPVVLVTTPQTSTQFRLAALESGVDAFVQESADICEIAAIVRSLTRLHRAVSLQANPRPDGWQFDAEGNAQLQFFEEAPDAILIVDNATSRIKMANTAATGHYGYSASEFLAMDETALSGEPALAGGPHRKLQRRKDGSTFLAEVTKVSFQIDGQPASFIAVRDISAHAAAQEALIHSRDLMRHVIEHAPGSIVVMDRELRNIYLSQRFLAEYGLIESEALGKHHYEIFPDLPDAYKQAHLRALCGEIIRSDEDMWLRSDGSVQWGRWECRPWYAADGSVGGIIVYTELFTEQKRAEQALRESEERLKYALDGTGDGVWEWNAETNEVYLAPRWKEILGYQPWEIPDSLGEWQSRIHPDDRAEVFEVLNQHLLGETPSYSSEHRLRCKDGSYKWLLDRGKVITRTISGKPLRIFGAHVDISARKELEEEKKIRQEQLETIFNNIPVMIAVFDASGQMRLANTALEQTLGWTREDYQKFGSFALCTSGPKEEAEFLAQFLKEAGKWTTWHPRAKDGRLVDTSWLHVNLSDGRVIAIGEDMTERRRSEREVRESQKRLEDIIFSMGDWVWEVDENGVYTYSSGKGVELFGSARGDIVGKTPFDFMSPEETFRVGAIFADLVAKKAPIRDLENWNIAANGEEICLLTNGVPILDEAGNLKGYRGVDKDITARKRAEVERARLITAIDQAREAILITDADSSIVYANPAAERTSGYSLAEIRGQSVNALKSGKHPESFYQNMWATLEAGEVWRGRFHNRRKNGTFYLEDATISPVRDASGRVVNYIAVKLDVTHESELQAQLVQAQKMESVGRLAGGVAHDFNNLLTVINGYTKMILGGLRQADPLRPQLEEVEKAGERASALTRQLLAFSRKQVLQPRLFDLNDVLGGIQPMLERLVGPSLQIQFDLSPDLAIVNADPHQIEQVIMNLAINARDAMPSGGKIAFTTKVVERHCPEARPNAPAEPHCMLAVSDTGTGIDPAILDRIFDPFFTTKATGEGTGLGLSMVQGIVAQSGGCIEVETNPGSGTTFRVYLPAAEMEATARDTQAPTTPVTASRGTETILLVEDQPEVLTFTEAVLKSYGYDVLSASNADEALALLNSDGDRIQLLLTDVTMPRMSGPDLAARVAGPKPGTPVLFMSGNTNEVALLEGDNAQCFNYIQKPFAPQDLAAAVRALLIPKSRKARVLVVDDEPGVRSYLRAVLEEANYEVADASDGKSALHYISTHPVDLVITDLVMPEKEGLETIQALQHSVPGVAIIAISGAFGGQFLQVAQMLGADEVLAKPVAAGTILGAVARQLATRKGQIAPTL